MTRPLIGITCDNKDNTAASGRYESPIAYSRAIAGVGGLPLLLPHEPALAAEYVELCAGVLITGGADLHMQRFGQAMHPKARPVDEKRQEFELAVLDALAGRSAKPALGICMGMQLMAMHAGGRLNQHLPDTLGDAAAEAHQKDHRHAVVLRVSDTAMGSNSKPEVSAECTVASWHHQAVEDPGTLRLVATSPDGVIEAIDDPNRPFYVGVQWHPERGGAGAFNRDLLARFVDACRRSRAGS